MNLDNVGWQYCVLDIFITYMYLRVYILYTYEHVQVIDQSG